MASRPRYPVREKNVKFYRRGQIPRLTPASSRQLKHFSQGREWLDKYAQRVYGKWYNYWAPSPNQSDRPAKYKTRRNPNGVYGVVIHTTEGWGSPAKSFAKRSRGASSHYGVERDGSVSYIVPENRKAWHTGNAVNEWAVGIEVVGFSVDKGISKGLKSGKYKPMGFPDWQITSLAKLVAGICRRNKFRPTRRTIFGHRNAGGCGSGESSGKAKPGQPILQGKGGGKGCHYDPGDNFPWKSFMKQVKWYYYRHYLVGAAVIGFLGVSGIIGYFVIKKRRQKLLGSSNHPPTHTGADMSRSAIGAIAAVVALGSAGSRGSSSRVFSDSQKMKTRFKQLNGMRYDEVVELLLKHYKANLADPRLYRIPLNEHGYSLLPLFPTTNDAYPYALQFKKLSGDPIWVQFLIDIYDSRIEGSRHPAAGATETPEEWKEILTEILEDLESYGRKPGDPFTGAEKLEILRHMELSAWGREAYAVPGQPYQMYISIPTMDAETVAMYLKIISYVPDYFDFGLRSSIEHEFYHLIDPAKGGSSKQTTHLGYLSSRRERATWGQDMVKESSFMYQASDPKLKKLFLEGIREGNIGTIMGFTPSLLLQFIITAGGHAREDGDTELADNFHAQWNTLISPKLNTISQNPSVDQRVWDRLQVFKVDVDGIAKKSAFFQIYSVKKWMKMLKTYFRDRGLI